jgi:hypothetical protein
MRTLISLVLLLTSAAIASSAQAQGQDGSFFLQACGAAVKQSDGGKLLSRKALAPCIALPMSHASSMQCRSQ